MRSVYIADSVQIDTGAKVFKLSAAATINATTVNKGKTKLKGGSIKNTSAGVKYVKLYDKGASVPAASDVPIIKLALSAGETVNVKDIFGNEGITFQNGLGIMLTGAPADNDVTAVAANDLHLNLTYLA